MRENHHQPGQFRWPRNDANPRTGLIRSNRNGQQLSSGLRSRKARNLAADPRCTVTTDDARDPVVVEGVAERLTGSGDIEGFVAAVNEKYDAGMTAQFQDPAVNGTFAVRPGRAFALTGDDFPGSPTRWTFAAR